MDESQRKQIWKMRAEGLGYGLIGKATGLSRDSVKKYCKRNPALLGHGAATKQMAKADQNDGLRCPQCYQVLKIHKTGRPKKFCSDKCRKVWWITQCDEHDKSKTAYPVGTKVRLVRMDDPHPVPKGTLGTVIGVDDIGSLLVKWENGSCLNVLYGIDIVEKVL